MAFFDTLKARETKQLRFVYKIQGPPTDKTNIRLRFYNPASREQYDHDKPFQDTTYKSADLKRLATIPPATESSPGQAQAVRQAFLDIQHALRNGEYEAVWDRFTRDYQEAEFQDSPARS